MRSDEAKCGKRQSPGRSLYNALGYTKEELDKPGANEFTIKAYEELLHKLECNINYDILNKK